MYNRAVSLCCVYAVTIDTVFGKGCLTIFDKGGELFGANVKKNDVIQGPLVVYPGAGFDLGGTDDPVSKEVDDKPTV